ncbi:rhodanese-related sulfurtransferase [Bacillus mesophilus]|nr:rhodanese-related sulfurtransferase [Bacillus mesophilus]
MVCCSGNRSGKATELLQDRGFRVINMTGGLTDWKDEVEKS